MGVGSYSAYVTVENGNGYVDTNKVKFSIYETCPHKYDGGKVTKDATCTAEGVKTFTCTICKATKTEKIPPIPHRVIVDKAVPATCTSKGKTEGSHCSVCGKVIKAQTDIAPIGHKYDNGKITTSASCTTEGVKTFACTNPNCTATRTEKIAKLPHTEVIDKAVSATCTSKGKTDGSHCSVCGTVIKQQTETPIIPHNYVDTVIAPTCTEKGYTNHVCSVCGNSYKDSETDIIPHDYEEKITPATCTEKGIRKLICKNCGYTETEDIPPIGHEFIDTTIEPTCYSEGYGNHKCENCDYEYRDNIVPKLPVPDENIIMGDVNGDNQITTLDALEILKHIVRLSTLDENQLKAADMNGDGKLSSADALEILMIIVGIR